MKKVLRFLTLAAMLCIPWVTQAQATLTVYDGSATSSYVPVYGTWADAYLKCEFVIPAADLAAMDGCPITQMDFYLTTPATAAWTGTFQVFLKEVGSTTLDAYSGTTDATIVYEGALDATSSTMTVAFDNDYDYSGGNLLVGVYQTISGNWKGATFAGQASVTGASAYGYNSSSLESASFNQTNFIPKTTFTYTPAAGYCFAPTSLVATVTPGSGTIATLNWTAGGTETAWVVEYSTASDFTGALSENVSGTPTLNLTGLTAETQYYARVKTDCGGGSESAWSNTVTFTPSNAYTLTVNDGTATNGYIPVYGYYVDGSIVSQFIIPAATLASIQYGTINEMTFYASTATASWAGAQFEVYMTEVDYTTFASTTLVDWASMTKVMNAAHLEISGNQMVVTLDSPYQYMGGNLMIGVKQTTSGSWGSCSWLGVSAPGASLGGNNSGSQQNFLPKTTFSFTPGAAPTCPKPTDLTVDNSSITAHGATLSWTENGTATQWQICLNGDEEHPTLVSANPYTFTTQLDQDADYAVKVRAYCAADDQSAWSNEVNFHTLVACAAPTALTATDITADGATLGWTAPDPAPANGYNVRYRRAYVGGASQDFEGDLTGWTAIDADGDGYGWALADPSGIQGHSSTYCVYSESYDQNVGALTPDNYLVSPLVALGGSITFYAAAQDADYPAEYFGVAVSTTSNTDPNTFTTLQNWTMSANPSGAKAQGSWGQFTVDLSAYVGQTGYVAIRHYNCSDQFYLIVDDIVITAPAGIGEPDPWTNTTAATNSKAITGLNAETTYEFEVQSNCGGETSTWAHATFATAVSCQPVTNLAFSAATSSTATITWTAGGEETAWKVYLYDGSDNLITGYPVDVTSATYTFPGLIANTPYKAGVKSDCGGTLAAERNVMMRTECDPITTIPYEESFESTGIYCWGLDGFTTVNLVTYAHSGNIALYSDANHDIYALLPVMDDDIADLMLNFWYMNNTTINCGTLYVGYLTDPADYSTFTSVGSIDMSTGITVYAQTHDYTFEAAPTGSRMAIKVVPESSTAIYIDDVTVAVRPNCMKPYDLAITPASVDAHGATLTWTSSASAWQVSYSVKDADTWSTPVDVATATYTFAGLTPETAYDVRVRTDCGSSVYSDWATLANAFTTDIACFAPTALASSNVTNHEADITWTGTADSYNVFVNHNEVAETYLSENFSSAIPGTWTNASTYPWSIVDGYIKTSNAGVGSSTSEISFTYTLAEDGKIEFDAECRGEGTSTVYDKCQFFIDGVAQFTYGSSVMGWNHYSFNLTSGEHTFKWSYSKDSSVNPTGDYMAVDNIAIVRTNVIEESYSTTENNYHLTNLDPSTTYSVQVQADCGTDGLSSKSTAHVFTTDIACPAPTGLAVSDRKHNQATLSWTSFAGAWDVCVNGDEGHPIEIDDHHALVEGTTITYVLDGLDELTNYTVKVRNNCGGGDGVSEWSNEVAFQTLRECATPENVVVSNVTNESAVLTWEGNAPFFVKYREAAYIDGTTEEFNANSIPTGWERYSALLNDDVLNGTTDLSTTTSGWSTTTYALGNYNIKINIWGSSTNYWLITPATDLAADAALSFDLALTDYGNSDPIEDNTAQADDRFVVLVTTDDMDTWTILREWNNSGSSYVYNNIATAGENVNIDLSAYAGQTVRIAFYGESTVTSNGDNDLHIDNVVIGTEVPAGSWELADEGNPIDDVTVTLRDLRADTKYEAVVYPECDDALESDPVFFTTISDPVGLTLAPNVWHAIASPMHTVGQEYESFDDIDNLTTGTYDLLRWYEYDAKWQSQKEGANHTHFENMERGRGYIFRFSGSSSRNVIFNGIANSGAISFNASSSTSYYATCGDLKGFNLIGNPYNSPCSITNDFYELQGNGMWTVSADHTLDVFQAVMVKVANTTAIPFTPGSTKGVKGSAETNLVFSVSNGEYTDIAYARFNGGESLPKFGHLTEEAPMLSIAQDEHQYAIAVIADDAESFPMRFSGNGDYTLTVGGSLAGFNYLHLIDHVTGSDIDLLRTPEYTFNGFGSADRFTVKLSPYSDETSFVRVSGSRIIVDGEGELQVFDVMGRQLGNAQVNGTTNLDRSELGIVSAGVYVLRLNGESQKIVVK